MIVLPPEDFEEVQSMLRLLRDSQTKLITTMAAGTQHDLLASICASIISLHMIVEQLLVNATTIQE